jgi:pilus assembly protein CpaF
MSFFNTSKTEYPENKVSLENRMLRKQSDIESYETRIGDKYVDPDPRHKNYYDRGNNKESHNYNNNIMTTGPSNRSAFIKNNGSHSSKDENQTIDNLAEQKQKENIKLKEQEELAVQNVRKKIKDMFGDRIKDERNSDKFKKEVHDAIDDSLRDEASLVRTVEHRERLNVRIYNLIMGLGPLELLFTKGYSEIMVSRYDRIFVEDKGKMKLVDVQFGSEEELNSIIEQMVSRIGRTVNSSTPTVDGRMEDGSRFNAVLMPVAVDGAQLTIRRFPEKMPTEEDYIKYESLDYKILRFFKLAVEAKWNLIVSGGTGSGKTSLLNLMSNFLSYDPGLSVVTIEDSCELRINHPNVRRYETKTANAAGTGAITSRDLVKNVMRVRPDVVIIGEIRDGTMADFLRLNTSGHEGGMTTVHSDSPEELENTIQILFQMAPDYNNFTENAISRLYADAVDLIIQIKRYSDHVRRISQISHVVGYGKAGAKKLEIAYGDPEYNPTEVYVRDIFVWRKTGVRENGVFEGSFEATGYVPKGLIEKADTNGLTIDENIFKKEVNNG